MKYDCQGMWKTEFITNIIVREKVEFKSVDPNVNPWKVFSSYFVPQIGINLLSELPSNAINYCYTFQTSIADRFWWWSGLRKFTYL